MSACSSARNNTARLRAVGVLVACHLVLSACGGQDPAQQTPANAQPTDVGVVTLSRKRVPRTTELAGRVVARETAEIRPQVNGIVRRRLFREGAPVNQGDILFQLDASEFETARDAAAATLQRAEATVASAKTTLERTEALAAANAVSIQDREDDRTALLQAQAEEKAARADLATAQLNLNRTTVRASLTGIVGTSAVSIGSLVTANQVDALATIRQVHPIYVEVVESSANLLAIREQLQTGTLKGTQAEPPKVSLVLENGSAYQQHGTLSASDIEVSESTGTFRMRATFPNPERILMPGMFVRATVTLGTTEGYLVPERAVTRNTSGEALAFFAVADGTAAQRVLQTERLIGTDWLVTTGVTDGDRVIVDGLQKVSNGSKVKAVEVTIDQNGVVRQTLAKSPGAQP